MGATVFSSLLFEVAGGSIVWEEKEVEGAEFLVLVSNDNRRQKFLYV